MTLQDCGGTDQAAEWKFALNPIAFFWSSALLTENRRANRMFTNLVLIAVWLISKINALDWKTIMLHGNTSIWLHILIYELQQVESNQMIDNKLNWFTFKFNTAWGAWSNKYHIHHLFEEEKNGRMINQKAIKKSQGALLLM